jgi:multiple sugar transport system permease protein
MKTWIREHLSFSYRKQIHLYLIPYLVGSFILIALPAGATVVVAFTRYHAIRPPVWAGLDNFAGLIASPLVLLALRNTLIFLALAVPLRLLGALSLALLLQYRRKSFGLYRAAVYLPTIVPEAAYALVWLWIFNPVYGPLNAFLRLFNLPAPAWLVEPGSARLAMVILSLFQIGEGFIVLLAGLRNIPRSLYESARIDGATNWHSFWKITFPMLTPWMLLLTFRDIVMSLQNSFTPSYILTYGGPHYATTFAPLLIYELAFDFFDLGLAAALLVVVFLLIALVVVGILDLVGLRGRPHEF